MRDNHKWPLFKAFSRCDLKNPTLLLVGALKGATFPTEDSWGVEQNAKVQATHLWGWVASSPGRWWPGTWVAYTGLV